MLVITPETILKYYCPEGFAQSVHACFDLRNCFEIFLSRSVAYFDLRKYFRTFLSGKLLLNPFIFVLFSENILEYLCPGRFAEPIHACFVLRNYLRTFLSRKICSLIIIRKFHLLKISTSNNSNNSPPFLLKTNHKKEKLD